MPHCGAAAHHLGYVFETGPIDVPPSSKRAARLFRTTDRAEYTTARVRPGRLLQAGRPGSRAIATQGRVAGLYGEAARGGVCGGDVEVFGHAGGGRGCPAGACGAGDPPARGLAVRVRSAEVRVQGRAVRARVHERDGRLGDEELSAAAVLFACVVEKGYADVEGEVCAGTGAGVRQAGMTAARPRRLRFGYHVSALGPLQ